MRDYTLLAVGDDDQSIYSFRRAHPVGIQRFISEDYTSASDYTLSISQRCGSSILKWARHVIEGLPGRPRRPALLPAKHCSQGETHYLRFDSYSQERRGVAKLVYWLINTKEICPEDIAILFRTNYHSIWSTTIMESLQELGIPVVNLDSVNAILTQSSNRRLLAIARLIVNKKDSLAWWTILEITRGIGIKVRDDLFQRAISNSNTFGNQLLIEYMREFSMFTPAKKSLLIDTIRPIYDLIHNIDISGVNLGKNGWGSWLAEQADIFGGCDDSFKSLLGDLDGVIDRSEGLDPFLNQIQPVGKDLRSGRTAQAVRLMTMMSSKGLTVRAVFIVGAEENVIPLAKRDRKEERRILYVAMTRSTEYLYLTWSRYREGPTAQTGTPNVRQRRSPSSFLIHGPVRSKPGEDYLESITI